LIYLSKGGEEVSLEVDKEARIATVVCNGCGGTEVYKNITTFGEAILKMKEDKTQAIKNTDGEWEHYCFLCTI
jgi:hypothetical protein